MALFRRDPFLDTFFGPSLSNSLAFQTTPDHGQYHFHETENAVTLAVDVPGVSAKDLQVQFEDNVLRVSGERKTSGRESKFVRSFSIDPKNVDVENIKANLDCGVLTLIAPKRVKPAFSKTIIVTESPPTIEEQPKVVANNK